MTISEIYEVYKQYPVITTDTRNCIKDSIFIALKGETFDGNLFVEQALASGCAYAITTSTQFAENKKVIQVDDTLQTLQDLARYHRKQLAIPVIAITGTNGKTTTKELVAAVLSTQYNILFTQGNLNNHIGVPLTLLKLTSAHQLAVIEMGASHVGEIAVLASIAEPDYGIITNVGKAHLEGFGSFEDVIRTKGELYDFIRRSGGKIFINHENPYLNNIAGELDKIYYGETSDSFVWGKITGNTPFLTFEYHTGNKVQPISTQLIGSYNFENALAAVAIGEFFTVSDENINRSISNYVPQNNRSQLKKTEANTLIIDAYNANPTSMLAALDNFSKMDVSPKALILGDMKELGKYSEQEHQKVVDFIKENNFEKVFLCGENFSLLANNPFTTFNDTEGLMEKLKIEGLKGYSILIKGSRSIRLEKVIELL